MKRIVFAKEAPEPGFDPLTASQEELAAYGLPPRPDPRHNRAAFANWQRAMSPPLRFVTTELLHAFAADPSLLFALSVTRRQRVQDAVSPATEETSRNWSGAYLRDRFPETYVLIQGTWTVPRPYPPPPAAPGDPWLHGDYFSSAWIGLDGHDPGSLSLPQIGIAHHVDLAQDSGDPSKLVVEVGAWWQWWEKYNPGNTQVDILPNQFLVQPGDVIYAQINVLGSNRVRYFLKNQSSGQVLPSFDVTAPTGARQPGIVEGRTAAWIVERPTKPGSVDLLPFGNFGSLGFSGCNAQIVPRSDPSLPPEDRQLQRARLIRLADWTPAVAGATDQPGMHHPGVIVSSASRSGDDAVLLTYHGAPP